MVKEKGDNSADKKSKKRTDILKQIKDLSAQADRVENHGKDLFAESKLGDEDIDISFDTSALKDTANPEKSYILYYGIRGLLIDGLPKGNGKNKELRQAIYDEKNLFLNRGIDKDEEGLRGSDGRMTYIHSFLVVAFKIVSEWIAQGAAPYDIYMAFWDLNESKGYHKPAKNLPNKYSPNK